MRCYDHLKVKSFLAYASIKITAVKYEQIRIGIELAKARKLS